jgi:uncharacterized surface protein with fasciclin (FAS1) repeats
MNTLTRPSLAAALTLVTALGLAACSGDDDTGPSPAETAAPAVPVPVDPALAGLVGPGCAAIVKETPKGAGSIAGLSGAMLTEATSKSPLLHTLNRAATGKLNKKVKLGETLDGGEYTVFAPVDSAFGKLSSTTVAQLKSDGRLLTKVLTYHLIAGQLGPNEVVGKHKTVEGGNVRVARAAGGLTVDGAHVVCGGIRTVNATLYLVDQVLTPPR